MIAAMTNRFFDREALDVLLAPRTWKLVRTTPPSATQPARNVTARRKAEAYGAVASGRVGGRTGKAVRIANPLYKQDLDKKTGCQL